METQILKCLTLLVTVDTREENKTIHFCLSHIASYMPKPLPLSLTLPRLPNFYFQNIFVHSYLRACIHLTAISLAPTMCHALLQIDTEDAIVKKTSDRYPCPMAFIF